MVEPIIIWLIQPNIFLRVWLKRLFKFCNPQTIVLTLDISISVYNKRDNA